MVNVDAIHKLTLWRSKGLSDVSSCGIYFAGNSLKLLRYAMDRDNALRDFSPKRHSTGNRVSQNYHPGKKG